MQPSCKVLLVDDCQDIYDLISTYASNSAIEVEWAPLAETGQRRFREDCFDIVLMDLHLPDLAGSDLVKNLRSWEKQWRKDRTPIFALTDLKDPRSCEKMLSAGCSGLLGKPLTRQQFFSVVSHRRRPVAESIAQPRVTPQTVNLAGL